MTHRRISAHLADKIAPLRTGLFDSLVGTWYQLYYPQVGNGDQSGWKIGRFVPVPLGDYNCNDPEVYAHHLRIFMDAGIDFVIIDGTNTLTAAGTLDNTKRLMDFLDRKPAEQRIGVAMAIGAHWWKKNADGTIDPIDERRARHIARRIECGTNSPNAQATSHLMGSRSLSITCTATELIGMIHAFTLRWQQDTFRLLKIVPKPNSVASGDGSRMRCCKTMPHTYRSRLECFTYSRRRSATCVSRPPRRNPSATTFSSDSTQSLRHNGGMLQRQR